MTSQNTVELLDKAEDKCKAQGVKLTTKRKLVLQQLIETESLMSAYDIVDRLKVSEKSTMPAMSVYRILDFLETSNLVHKLESQNKYVACRHIRCDHNHQSAQFLICQNCSYVQEVNLGHGVMSEINALAADEQFKLEFSVMEFKGQCADCQQPAS